MTDLEKLQRDNKEKLLQILQLDVVIMAKRVTAALPLNSMLQGSISIDAKRAIHDMQLAVRGLQQFEAGMFDNDKSQPAVQSE